MFYIVSVFGEGQHWSQDEHPLLALD